MLVCRLTWLIGIIFILFMVMWRPETLPLSPVLVYAAEPDPSDDIFGFNSLKDKAEKAKKNWTDVVDLPDKAINSVKDKYKKKTHIDKDFTREEPEQVSKEDEDFHACILRGYSNGKCKQEAAAEKENAEKRKKMQSIKDDEIKRSKGTDKLQDHMNQYRDDLRVRVQNYSREVYGQCSAVKDAKNRAECMNRARLYIQAMEKMSSDLSKCELDNYYQDSSRKKECVDATIKSFTQKMTEIGRQ